MKLLLRKLVCINHFLTSNKNVAWKKSYFIRDFLTQVSKRCLKLCLSLVNSPPAAVSTAPHAAAAPIRAVLAVVDVETGAQFTNVQELFLT
jgi:hypothetical protein